MYGIRYDFSRCSLKGDRDLEPIKELLQCRVPNKPFWKYNASI